MENDLTDDGSDQAVIPPDNPDPIEAKPVDGDSSYAEDLVHADELIPGDQPDPMDVTPSESEEASR